MTYYGWTYAGNLRHRVKLKPSRRNRGWLPASSMKVLALRTKAAAAKSIDHASRTSRVLVAAALVFITLVVLGRASTLPMEVTGHLWTWLEDLKRNSFETPAAQTAVRSSQRMAVPPSLAKAAGASMDQSAVSVAERDLQTIRSQPLAVIADSGLFYFNAEGKVWPIADEAQPQDLPILTGVHIQEVPGSMGIVLKTQVNAALVSKILGAGFSSQLSEIHLTASDDAVLYTRDGIKIYLRQGLNLDRDLLRLGAVLADIRAKDLKIAVMDLRYEQNIIVRPKLRR